MSQRQLRPASARRSTKNHESSESLKTYKLKESVETKDIDKERLPKKVHNKPAFEDSSVSHKD